MSFTRRALLGTSLVGAGGLAAHEALGAALPAQDGGTPPSAPFVSLLDQPGSDNRGAADNSRALQALAAREGAVFLPPGDWRIDTPLDLLATQRDVRIHGAGTATRLVMRAPLLRSNDYEKLFRLQISNLTMHSDYAGPSFVLDYPAQSSNQQKMVRFDSVLFSGHDGCRLVNSASIRFNACEWVDLTGTALYFRRVVGAEIYGGLIAHCREAFNVDGDPNEVVQTAGIRFEGTRVIACPDGARITSCDWPVFKGLFDYNGPLLLANNIGGLFEGYFGGGHNENTEIVRYVAGISPSTFIGRFTCYGFQHSGSGNRAIEAAGPVIIMGSQFQDAILDHVRHAGAGLVFVGNYCQLGGRDKRSIEINGSSVIATINSNIFELIGTGHQAFPASIPPSWIVTGNKGCELDDLVTTVTIRRGESRRTQRLARKSPPRTVLARTPGFAIWATADELIVATQDGRPAPSDVSVECFLAN